MRKVLATFLMSLPILTSQATAAEDASSSGRLYDVPGGKLYTQIFGRGPPILFLHGGTVFFDNNFEHQRDYFASYRTVIGIDQRGRGHSPDSPGPFSYKQMAEDTAAVIAQLGVGPVDIVGHSDGGNIGLILARDHPQLVGRLVVSGADLRPGLSPEELQRRRQWSPEQIQEKVRALDATFPPWFRHDYEKVSPDGPDHWMTIVAKLYRLWSEPDLITPEELKRITIPVLVVAGDHDFVSIEETVEIYRGLPRGQLMILPATGHGTFILRPDLSNLAIREFLEQPIRDSDAR